ncbi:MAG TPA: hypothetical protein P5191_14925 [Ruminococcus sp.]|nr:hypothetical protein [Ruminococcus sp.]
MSELAMTNDEIIMRYRQAKDKSEQVKILAELNDYPVERIIGILVASGEDNRKFNHLRGQLKKEETQKEQVEVHKEQSEAEQSKTEKVPKAVIAAVEDKITELQYMINQNKDQVKSLLQHNERFSSRIGILTSWLKEVKSNEST